MKADRPIDTETAIRRDHRLTDDQREVVLRLVAQFAADNARHLALVASRARNPRPTTDPTARETELRQIAGDHGLLIEETTDPNEDDPSFRTYAVIGQEGVDTLDDGLTLDEVAAFLAGYSYRDT